MSVNESLRPDGLLGEEEVEDVDMVVYRVAVFQSDLCLFQVDGLLARSAKII